MNKSVREILVDVAEDWKEQVEDMEDVELYEDRSEWIKTYGTDDDTDDIHDYHTDIHTLAIEVEQISRYGGIHYDKKSRKEWSKELRQSIAKLHKQMEKEKRDEMKEGIFNEIDSEKVGISFALFCLSKLSDELLHDRLIEFREVFKRVVMDKAKQDLPVNKNDDDITNQHKDIEVNREVEKTTDRNLLDLQMMIDKMRLNKKDWVRYLGL